MDIVERLRKQAWTRTGSPKMGAPHTQTVEWEAAYEIERLRQLLADKSPGSAQEPNVGLGWVRQQFPDLFDR